MFVWGQWPASRSDRCMCVTSEARYKQFSSTCPAGSLVATLQERSGFSVSRMHIAHCCLGRSYLQRPPQSKVACIARRKQTPRGFCRWEWQCQSLVNISLLAPALSHLHPVRLLHLRFNFILIHVWAFRAVSSLCALLSSALHATCPAHLMPISSAK